MREKRKLDIPPEDEEKILGINKFVEPLEIKAVRIESGAWITETTKVKNTMTEEVTEVQITVPHTFCIEQDKSVRIYNKSKNRKIRSSLSDKALRLLNWLELTIEPGKDYVYFNLELYKSENNLKADNTIKAALDELITKNIVALTKVKRYFWLNAEFSYSGNRLNKYPNKVKIYETK